MLVINFNSRFNRGKKNRNKGTFIYMCCTVLRALIVELIYCCFRTKGQGNEGSTRREGDARLWEIECDIFTGCRNVGPGDVSCSIALLGRGPRNWVLPDVSRRRSDLVFKVRPVREQWIRPRHTILNRQAPIFQRYGAKSQKEWYLNYSAAKA